MDGAWPNQDMGDTFGKRLLSARTAKGLKQAEVAKASGLSQTMISELENDVWESTARIAELAEALGVDPIWLKTGKGSMDRAGGIDQNALRDAIKTVFLLSKEQPSLPADELADYAMSVYKLFVSKKERPDQDALLQFMRSLM